MMKQSSFYFGMKAMLGASAVSTIAFISPITTSVVLFGGAIVGMPDQALAASKAIPGIGITVRKNCHGPCPSHRMKPKKNGGKVIQRGKTQ